MTERQRTQVPIAVVGVSALFPGSTDARGFWEDILRGRDLVTDVPASHWLVEDYYDPDPAAPDKTYCKRGAFLPSVPFDPMEFGVPPNIVPATDTAQLLALIVAQRVLEDATAGQFASMDRERASVILGVTSAQELLASMVSRLQRPVWLKALREGGVPEGEAQALCDRMAAHYVPWQESSFPGLLGNVVAGRIANRFDLRGTNCVTDAACASTLSALAMGMNELTLGQSDLVITGGVDTMNDIFMYLCFSKTPALSPTGDCRPFSEDADGTLLGEGMAMLALKRLEDAERDGDRVYAVVRGLGSGSDGRSKSVYAPLPEGQARALRRAYEVAGFGPDTVELVEAHGTGTKAGDVAEFEGLRQAFDASGRAERQWCALGSVKSQIGHTKAAAGAAGLFKAVMALHHKVLPPTLKVSRPNPKLAIKESPFYLNTQGRPWIRDGAHPRRAAVSSFGFGGSNFHVALEEYVPAPGARARPAWRLRSAPTELVLVSAQTPEALAAACRALPTEGTLAPVARASQRTFRTQAACRLAVVASDARDLAAKLTSALGAIEKAPGQAFSTPQGVHYGHAVEPGQVALLFPGQGSQYVGMGADLAMAFDAARDVWDAAAGERFDAEALHARVFPRPVFTDADREAQERSLRATEWAQPALGVASLATLALLRAVGLREDCVGGHSFGEVTALCAAGALDTSSFLRVARRRGELMRDAAAIPGAMTAVSMPVDAVRALLEELGTSVVVANHNAPTQVVLSGSVEAVEALETALSARGVTARRLPVATAFHSALVAPSSAPFRAHLAAVPLAAPAVDVYGNADAAPYPKDSDAARDRLAAQLALPVRFVDEIEAMYARGVRTFVEVGAGSVLTDLVGRILGERPHRAIATDRKGRHGVTSLQEALGRLCVAGLALDLEALWAPYAPAGDRAPKKALMTLNLNGSNHGKPYPPPGGARELPPPNPPRPEPAASAPAPVTVAVPPLGETMPTPPPAPSVPAHVAPASPSAPLPALGGEAQLAWVRAYQDAQRHTAEAHAAYQRAVADAHCSFLRTAESAFTGLTAMVTGQAVALAPRADLAPAVTLAPEPPASRAPVAAPTLPPVAVPPPAPVTSSVVFSQPPTDTTRTLPSPTSTVTHTPAPTPTVMSVPARDLTGLLLSVVADKTGYPAEMLGLGMELEADLGIDSIKRVEILSALREKAPDLPAVKPAEMAALRTLGQIVDYLRAQGGTAASVVSAPVGSRVEVPAAAAPSAPAKASTQDLTGLLLSVVADKTGYPAEMLGLGMELEADLGIDSIKRVEILSALREKAPDLPAVKPAEMAALRTLGQIVDYLRAQGGTAAVAPAPTTLAATKTPVVATAPVAETSAPRGVGRFAVREVPLAPVGLGLRGLHARGRAVVTDDGGGVAAALARRLSERGVAAEVVTEVPAEATVVLFLGGLREVRGVDDAVAVNREAFRAARSVAPRFAREGGVFVTVQDTGGDFGLGGREPGRAWLAGVAALARTAAQEWPSAAVRAVDLERGGRTPEALAEALAEELFQGGAAREVGLHADGRRSTLVSVETPGDTQDARALSPTDVVLASGGARGVTAHALVALARAHRPRVVLLGRTALADDPPWAQGVADEPGLKRAFLQDAQRAGRAPAPQEVGDAAARVLAAREARGTLDALRAAGSEARYVAVDVQHREALAAALADVRHDLGPITVVVHGAGVLADKSLADKTDAQFDRVFDTKVSGLRALLDATAADPLRALCVFSSVAARTGNTGQGDYAMANEVLNAVACAEAARRGAGCVVRSLAWGPWEGGMVTPALRARFEQLGVALIPLEAGARRFVEELTHRDRDVHLVLGGAPGEGPLGASSTRASTLEVRVDARSHPHLADHAVEGAPVLPVALCLEWFVRAAASLHPELQGSTVRHLKVLRGVRLERYHDAGDVFTVAARQLSNGGDAIVEVELRGRGEALHYRATVELTARAPTPGLAPGAAGTPERWSHGAMYDGRVLFHGPRFQGIRAVDGVSAEGITGTLVGVRELRWDAEPWRTDPLAVDGALQLVLLWVRHVLGGASLPMAVGEFHLYRPGPVAGSVTCRVRGTHAQDARAVCDAVLLDADGAVLAELRGIEAVLRPAEPARAAPAQV